MKSKRISNPAGHGVSRRGQADNPRSADGCRGGFTLIELLVVVAIISLLVSILLPSLNRAKEEARAVLCATNMKSIGLATMMYAGDYGGYLAPINPYGFTVDPFTKEHYQGALSLWYNGLYRGLGLLITNSYLPYVKPGSVGPDMIYCPETRQRFLAQDPPIPQMLCSYYYTGGLKYTPAFTWDLGPRANIETDDPACCLLFEWSLPHRGKSNVLFLGGHVERKDPHPLYWAQGYRCKALEN